MSSRGEVIPDIPWVREQLGPSAYAVLKSYVDVDLKHLTEQQRVDTLEFLWDFKKANVALCLKEFKPLPADYDYSVEAWLPKTSYRVVDKERILRTVEKVPLVDVSDMSPDMQSIFDCECFIKSEPYPEWKPARPIKSRTDRWKAHVGPGFQAIGEILFGHKFFIKKIPLYERTKYMKEMFERFKKLNCTDFSKFESHFIRCVMECCEFVFYDYCLLLSPIRQWFMADIRVVLAGRQKFVYPWFTTSFDATRASGEMCTSSGNGFSNYAIFNYLCELFVVDEKAGVFEGDDSVNSVLPVSVVFCTQDYTDMGWNCKLNQTENFNEASFCGIVGDPDDLVQVCDVREAVANFGWTGQRYVRADWKTRCALLRAKGYSMIYQYPGCPVLQELGVYALRVTNIPVVHDRLIRLLDTKQLWCDSYTAMKFQHLEEVMRSSSELPLRSVPLNTRVLVARLYNISVDEQIVTEGILRDKSDFGPVVYPFEFPIVWGDCWDKYVRDYDDVYSLFVTNPDARNEEWLLKFWHMENQTNPNRWKGNLRFTQPGLRLKDRW